MKTFLRRIRSDVNRQELREFLSSAVRPRWYWPFRDSGTVAECKILKIEGPGGVEYHGLAEINPDRAALRAIMVLNGKRIHGTVVELRQWFDRSQEHDRRRQGTAGRSANLAISERRNCDRRRNGLSVEVL